MSTAKKIMSAADMGELTLMYMRTENVKRVRFVELVPREDVTIIGGDNSNGKTSFLDSYEWALGGKAVISMEPIHRGQQKGSVLLKFGDGQTVKLIVERTLKRLGDDDFTAEVAVTIPDGIAPKRIQDFLDELRGEYSVDPLAFLRLSPREQFDALRAFVPDVDFVAIDRSNEIDFKKRTEINRQLKEARAATDVIAISEEPPFESVNEAELTDKLQRAGDHNTDINRRRQNRADMAKDIDQLRAAAAASLASVDPAIEMRQQSYKQTTDDLREQIKALEAKIAQATDSLVADVAGLRKERQAAADERNRRADSIKAELDAAAPLDELTDTVAIAAQLKAAQETNRALDNWERQRDRKRQFRETADALAEQHDTLTAHIAARTNEKQEAIRKAHLPVDGLGFGDGFITLNGFTFEQAGQAEKVDASMAIAMALRPKLKVILIREGSDLGSKMKLRIAQRARERGYRVLMEIVDDTGANSHVVIEDGVMAKEKAGLRESAA